MAAPNLEVVILDGDLTIKLTCPACGTVGHLDADQAAGLVSVECGCGGYHETHDYWALLPPEER